MDAYTLRFLNLKLILVAITAFSISLSFGQQNASTQDVIKKDTLLYFWHSTEYDDYPDLIPEDNYIELYLVNGVVEKGFFWGTTDEFEDAREGYRCGFFVLPLSEIRQYRDSVSFQVGLCKTEKGERIYSFVRVPINRHIRSWQDALTYYQRWTVAYGGYREDIRYNIYSDSKNKDTDCLLGDTILVRNLSYPYTTLPKFSKRFIRQKND